MRTSAHQQYAVSRLILGGGVVIMVGLSGFGKLLTWRRLSLHRPTASRSPRHTGEVEPQDYIMLDGLGAAFQPQLSLVSAIGGGRC